MNSDQLYANGRVAVLSNKVLGADRLLRLAECSSTDEAVRVLRESGYGGTAGASLPDNDYERLLGAELDSVFVALKELCYDAYAVKYFLCPYDYANAKTLMKGKYMRADFTQYCFTQTLYDCARMNDDFVNDDYSAYPVAMATACDAIDARFADGDRSPQIVDMYLDRACYADMRVYAKRSSIPLVNKLYRWQADTVNIMCVVRLKNASLPEERLDDWFAEGGSLTKSAVLQLCNGNAVMRADEHVAEFARLCLQGQSGLQAAQKMQISYRNELIEQSKDLLTIQPVLQYFYTKTDEIQKVRYILSDVKNGVDKDRIKDRLK